MLRMSKLADYAFVTLSHMMLGPAENWSASALAAGTGLPLPTVAKLMKLLARGGLVTASRGAAGGYRLARPARDVSIVHVIESVDGPISLTECAGKAAGKTACDCAMGQGCPVRERWTHVNASIMAALESVRLSDFSTVAARTG